MSWTMNDISFPSWAEFGKLENGNYYVELLDDNQERIKVKDKEQQEKNWRVKKDMIRGYGKT